MDSPEIIYSKFLQRVLFGVFSLHNDILFGDRSELYPNQIIQHDDGRNHRQSIAYGETKWPPHRISTLSISMHLPKIIYSKFLQCVLFGVFLFHKNILFRDRSKLYPDHTIRRNGSHGCLNRCCTVYSKPNQVDNHNKTLQGTRVMAVWSAGCLAG